ncbi:MAG: glycosyltransferase family 4 protein [Candidatus Uhrbacteria bacterium]|nr:glycosyltransferase family 4 protein [Patescibacteria group bacterium]MBU1907353.1 glycosyltransferase family 4 protein [Patescibacteria group bacterium]
MRIAQVTPVYPPYRGGIGAVAFEYTERLRERGHDVQVFTPDYRPEPSDPKYVHRLKPLIAIGNAAVVPSLKSKLSEFDVVHLHYPFFGGAEFVALRKLFGRTPLVTTYHMDVFGSGLKGLVFRTYGKVCKGLSLAVSDRVLVSSLDYAMNSSIKNYVSNNLESVIEMPFGIDTERFQPVSNRRQPSLPPAGARAPAYDAEGKAPRIIFVGGLDRAHYFKGLPVLIEALKEIRDLPWKLVVVGEGDLRASFEQTVARQILHDRIIFVGGVDPERLAELYCESDLHVLPAIDSSEAFGIVTLEAGASGIPSIVSDLPGVRSVIEEGKTGLLAQPGDSRSLASALEDLLTNPDRRKQYGIDARKRMKENYAWSVLLDRLEEVYESVL